MMQRLNSDTLRRDTNDEVINIFRSVFCLYVTSRTNDFMLETCSNYAQRVALLVMSGQLCLIGSWRFYHNTMVSRSNDIGCFVQM